jgi:hypothetical protein
MFPPIRLIEFWWRSVAQRLARFNRNLVNFPRQVAAPSAISLLGLCLDRSGFVTGQLARLRTPAHRLRAHDRSSRLYGSWKRKYGEPVGRFRIA